MAFILSKLYVYMVFPIVLIMYFCSNRKNGAVFSLLIGLFFGILAYNFLPLETYDLVVHKELVNNLIGKDLNFVISYYKLCSLEIMPYAYSYIISLTRDPNLLQFFIVTMGYSILFYIFYDYKRYKNISNASFIMIVTMAITGFHYLYFISGLFFYIGIIMLFLAYYLDYYKNKKKLAYILYLIVVFMHDSLFYPIFILAIYKICGNKLNIKSILSCVIIFFLMTNIILFLNNQVNIKLLNTISSMINSYIYNNYKFIKFYSGNVWIIETTKILISTFTLILNKKYKTKSGGFLFLLILSTIIMLQKSIVMIRFAMLIHFIGSLFLIDDFSKKKKSKYAIFYYLIVLLLTILYFGYFLHLITSQNYGNLFN